MDSNPGRVNTKPVIFKLVFAASPAKQVALRTNSKDWSVGNHDNVSEWSDMFTSGMLCFGE
jgi:hypothetical protein